MSDGSAPRLIHLNGPPCIGKSTLAARFVADHPLALNLDIDVLRTWLGRWQERDEAKQIARDLAKGIVAAHLVTGHDVVLPQLILRPEVIEEFAGITIGAGGEFVEVILLGAEETSLERFKARRDAFVASGVQHPGADVPDGAEAEILRFSYSGLREMADKLAGARVIQVDNGDIDGTYRSLLAAIDERGGS
jgi:hypothetical protein